MDKGDIKIIRHNIFPNPATILFENLDEFPSNQKLQIELKIKEALNNSININ